MTRSKVDCLQQWNERRKKGKLRVGKLWLYTDNVPQEKPFMFEV